MNRLISLLANVLLVMCAVLAGLTAAILFSGCTPSVYVGDCVGVNGNKLTVIEIKGDQATLSGQMCLSERWCRDLQMDVPVRDIAQCYQAGGCFCED